MIVGEAPGFNEDRQGEPFVGAAGQLLDTMLARIGLRRADVYITNVLKCRPPQNRDPMPNEAEACSPYLRRQMELIRPKVVLILGRHALERLLPGQGSISRSMAALCSAATLHSCRSFTRPRPSTTAPWWLTSSATSTASRVTWTSFSPHLRLPNPRRYQSRKPSSSSSGDEPAPPVRTAGRPGRSGPQHVGARVGEQSPRRRRGPDVPARGHARHRPRPTRPLLPAGTPAQGPGHLPEPRPRGPHRWAALRAEEAQRARLRHAAHAGIGEAEAQGAPHPARG